MPHRFNEKHSGFDFSKGERVRMVIRRHWFVGVIILGKGIFWTLILPVVVFFSLSFFKNGIGESALGLSIVLMSVYIWGSLLWFLIEWLNSIFDVIIVTNDRVIDISQKDFFHRNVVETRLINVQDATGDVKGIINTMFDWGRVEIRTANDMADFSIDMVEHPHQKARHIFFLATKSQERETKRSFELEERFNRKRAEEKIQEDINNREKIFSPSQYRKKINEVLHQ